MKRFLSILFSSFLIISCSITPLPRVIRLRLPDPPDLWPGELLFSIKYRSGAEVVWLRDLKPREAVTIWMRPWDLSPLAAYPHLTGESAPVPGMKPAGVILSSPDSAPEGFWDEIPFSWHQGFAAELLLRFSPEERGMINISRLTDELAVYSDPWFIDPETLTDALLFHRFTSASVKELPLLPWTSGDTVLWWGNPLFDPLGPAQSRPGDHGDSGSGGEDTVILYKDIFRLAAVDADGNTILLQLFPSDDGWICVDPESGGVLRYY